jgi:hypothetical protein
MEDFLKGFAGIAGGFMLFMPFFVPASESGSMAAVDPLMKYPMILGLTIMFSSPIIFWWLKPLVERLRSS